MNPTIAYPVLILCSVLLIGIARHVSRLRGVPAVYPFMSLMIMSAAWTVLYTLNLFTDYVPLKLFWTHLQVLTSMFFAPAWFILAIEYSGYGGKITRRHMGLVIGLILVVPGLSAVAEILGHFQNAFTFNDQINFNSALPIYLPDNGPLHWVFMVYTLVLAVLACLVLVFDMVTHETQWKNTFSILAGILLPFLTNLAYNLGLFPTSEFDPTPLAFLLTGALYLLAVVQFRLFHVVPIARDTLLEHMSDAAFAVDMNGNLVDYNHAAQAAAGLLPRQLGKPTSLLPGLWADLLQGQCNEDCLREVRLEIGGQQRYFEIKSTRILDRRKRMRGCLYIFHDMSERKLVEELLELRLRLNEYAASHSLSELMTRALDEIGAITNSPIGFYHLVSPDQKTISLQAWSTRTLGEFCDIENLAEHYDIARAGIWVECVHQRKPVIHNDYRALSYRRGLPKGHADLMRELVVPIMRDGMVVAVLGLGNKASEYTQTDVDLVAYIADMVWVLVERKRAADEIQALQDQLREQATRDPLTNLYNRRYLTETLARELARAERAGTAVSFVVLDIDHFKSVNDRFGHAVGDQVLQILAKVLTHQAREGDVICRFGGEEFLVVLPDTPPELAYQAAERWRIEFPDAVPLPLVDGACITISCGVATYPFHGNTAEALLSAADQALYQAKGSGRNKTVVLASMTKLPALAKDHHSLTPQRP